MSNNHTGASDHTFLGRKRKLSVWVKKIIQPARETSTSTAAPQPEPPTRTSSSEDRKQNSKEDSGHSSECTINEVSSRSSTEAMHELSPPRADSVSMKVLWGDEPKRLRQETDSDVVPASVDDSDSMDNVSIQALFSMCSSSFKSSTFSDVHSLQSTRATMASGRTTETNSSTVAIPPASILDRTRHGSTATSTTTNLGSPTSSLHHHHHHHPLHMSRPSSMRQTPIQRERERERDRDRDRDRDADRERDRERERGRVNSHSSHATIK
ncbi:uncharacterized protein ZBAI_01220 [Zygosaccharomyces bailii ISA1307]|nr:uncharacterized protein ZBAI_01220 [Zygosaccharomyces bailii ISA1307]